MCFPYKIELRIEGDLQEALLRDMFNNTRDCFKKGMCFDAIEKLRKQYERGIEKHMANKHKEQVKK